MKNRMPILLLLLIAAARCQPVPPTLSERDKLFATAKVWGFLKYYHPTVGQGRIEWDSQLFSILPKVTSAQNKAELSEVFFEWIQSLGEVPECPSCATETSSQTFDKNFNLAWIRDPEFFSKKLSHKLQYIEKNRFQGKNYYLGATSSGIFSTEHESLYKNTSWQDRNLRLLALFRYWNIVEYYFPYKYLMDQNWDLALKEMIPKFLAPASELHYHLAMHELVCKLNDTHSYFSSPVLSDYIGDKIAPVRFQLVEGQCICTRLLNDTLAKADDWKVGDIVLKVNGQPILEALNAKFPHINASNESVRIRQLEELALIGTQPEVEIEYVRDQIIAKKKIRRYLWESINFKRPSTTKWEIKPGNIGYINTGELAEAEIKPVMESLLSTKAIILDLRQYPKGRILPIGNFLTSKPVPFSQLTQPDFNYPGKFVWKEVNNCGSDNAAAYQGKVFILINEQTQSASEYAAMCFQAAPNSTLIGSQTAGADGNCSKFEFVGGFNTQMTSLGVYYPDGKETQRIGIVPDIQVKPTIKGVLDGKDEVLEKALELAQK